MTRVIYHKLGSLQKFLLVGGVLGALAACTDNPNQTKMQYFPDMADSPAFKTQGNYLNPPEGSVARTAILYPETIEEAEKVLKNPFRGQPDEATHAANGEHKYGIYCAVCHGIDAKGGGRISDKFPRPPDLTLDMYKSKQDGFFFYRMTFGSALMPSYGDKTTAIERWDINLHLTKLQHATPAAVVPAAPAAPAPEPAKTEEAK